MSEHGTRSMYVSGCRCDSCRRANNDWFRDYRHRKGISVKYYRREEDEMVGAW